MEFEVIDSKEVWWAVTNQYEVAFKDGNTFSFRAAEDPNGTDFYVLSDDGWSPLEDGNEYHDSFYEAWSEGTLD